MILVQGWVRFSPGGLEKLQGLIVEGVATAAKRAALYSMGALLEPDLLRISEVWESETAMKGHGAQPPTAAFRVAMREVGVEGMNVKAYSGAVPRQLLGSD